MKLEKAFEKIVKSVDACKWDVRIVYHPDCLGTPPVVSITANLNTLYQNWWDGANLCPENGEFIKELTLVNNDDGRTLMVDASDLREYTFEQFMEELHKLRFDVVFSQM